MKRQVLVNVSLAMAVAVVAGCPGPSNKGDSTATDTTPAAVKADSTATDTTPHLLDSTATDTTPAARAKRDSLAKAAKKP